MKISKELGKITFAKLGLVGCDNNILGVMIILKGKTYTAVWERYFNSQSIGHISKIISEILKDSKVQFIEDLVGKPVEMTFNDKYELHNWRILTEVL